MAAKRRVVLNDKLAAEIYEHKIAIMAPRSFDSCLRDPSAKMKGKSAGLSKLYDVSAKTIRDIWSRRTWVNATSHLWADEDSLGIDSQVTRIV